MVGDSPCRSPAGVGGRPNVGMTHQPSLATWFSTRLLGAIGECNGNIDNLLVSLYETMIWPIYRVKANNLYDQGCEDMIVVVRPLSGLIRLKRPHSVKPNIVVKTKIGQLELPPVRRISLGSQVLYLGKIRLEELISTKSNLPQMDPNNLQPSLTYQTGESSHQRRRIRCGK